MFGRRKHQETTSRESFITPADDLLKLIDQGDLNNIKRFMKKETVSPSNLLDLYGTDDRSIISAIIAKQNTKLSNYFFDLIFETHKSDDAQQKTIENAIRSALYNGHIDALQFLTPYWNGDISTLAKHLSFDWQAPKQNRVACLRFLLDHGTDPNTVSFYDSLLTQAVRGRNLDAVNLLLSRGATPELSGFRYSLHHGRNVDDIKIAEAILNAMNSPTPEQYKIVVDHALSVEDIDMLVMLINRGAVLDGSCLMKAVRAGMTQLFKALITDYANYFTTEDIKAAAISALEHGFVNMFENLYARLKSVCADDFAPYIHIEKQESPGFMNDMSSRQRPKIEMLDDDDLGFAPRRMNQEKREKVDFQQCLPSLLAKGLNPNALAENNKTLLSKAANANNIDACRALLLAGANPNLSQSTAPLVLAVNHRNPTLTSLLLEHGATIGDALITARKRRYADIASILESNHFYIHCGVLMLSLVGGGILNHGFSMLVKEPLLLDKLPHGFTANCNFIVLKDILPTLNEYDRLPDGVVDMGIDENDEHNEKIVDFYYDCEGLDKDTVLKAIEILKRKYFINDMSFNSELDINYNDNQEDREAKMMFDPVTVITNILLQILKPTPPASPKVRHSIFQPVKKDSSDEFYPDAESMSDSELDASAESGDDSSPPLKRRKYY